MVGSAQFHSVEGRALADFAAEQIRREIVAGRLMHGTRLREEDLATQLGISRGPVRQALQRLAVEGLLEARQRRGFVVRAFSSETILELCDLRLLLEPLLFSAAAKAATAENLTQLDRILAQLSAAADREDWGAVVDADMEFHCRVARMSGKVHVAQSYLILTEPFRAYIAEVCGSQKSGPEWVAEHRALLDVLRTGDGVAAANLIRQHLERDCQEIREEIAASG